MSETTVKELIALLQKFPNPDATVIMVSGEGNTSGEILVDVCYHSTDFCWVGFEDE